MNIAVLVFVEEDTEQKRARNKCMGKHGAYWEVTTSGV
jgi:hypothetical protein